MQIRQNPGHETEEGAATFVSRLGRDRGKNEEQNEKQKRGSRGKESSKQKKAGIAAGLHYYIW